MDTDRALRRVADRLPRARTGCVFSHGNGQGVVGGLRDIYTGNACAVYEWCVDAGLDAVWLHASRRLRGVRGTAHGFRSVQGAVASMRARVSMGGSNNGAPSGYLSDRTWVVQGWHGTPLKRIGRAAAAGGDPRGARLVERADFFLSPGQEFSTRFARCYDVRPEQFWTLGNPRNDVLVRADAAATRVRQEQLRAALRPVDVDRVILYAPTWRDWRSAPDFLPAPDRDLGRLDRWLRERNEVLVLRAHQLEARHALALTASYERIVVSDSLDLPWDVSDWCLAADLLVTDYSSVFYDYLLLDRPVVHLAPDLQEYADRRGFLVDPLSDFAGPVAATQSELLNALEDGLDHPEREASVRARLNRLHNPLEDGASTERVGRALLGLLDRPRDAA